MHKLEITGATPEDLFMNAVRMLTVLLKGGAQPMEPLGDSRHSSVVDTLTQGGHDLGAEIGMAPIGGIVAEPEEIITLSNDTKVVATTLASEEINHPVTAKAKRGRPAKADKVSEATETSEAPADLPTEKTIELNDDISDLGGKPAETERALTLNDDIRPRLQAIQKACVARGLDMPATVAYILKLYGPFGIKRADQLQPEQFAEFMEASEAYLSGEA